MSSDASDHEALFSSLSQEMTSFCEPWTLGALPRRLHLKNIHHIPNCIIVPYRKMLQSIILAIYSKVEYSAAFRHLSRWIHRLRRRPPVDSSVFPVKNNCIFMFTGGSLDWSATQAFSAAVAGPFKKKYNRHKAASPFSSFKLHANLIAEEKLIKKIGSNELSTWNFIWTCRRLAYFASLPATSSK